MSKQLERVLNKRDGFGERWARYIALVSEEHDGLTLRESREIVVGIVQGMEPPEDVPKRGGLLGLLEDVL